MAKWAEMALVACDGHTHFQGLRKGGTEEFVKN